MKLFKFLTIIILLLVALAGMARATIDNNDIDYAKNHLIVLVHGIGDDHSCFDNVKKYLLDNGLEGYVYAYEFFDPFLNIEKDGWEFGDRSYNNPEAVSKPSDNKTLRDDWEITKRENNGKGGSGKCWLEQAREDFRIWFKKYGPGKEEDRYPAENEIPSKYLLIAHSEGGLGARSYLTANYYNNDVIKLITIDTPHLGTDAVIYKKLLYSTESQVGTALAAGAGLTYITMSLMGKTGAPSLQDIYFDAAIFAAIVSPVEQLVLRDVIATWGDPGLREMDPDGDYIKTLNSTPVKNGSDPIEYRLISAYGVPSPDGKTIKELNALKGVPLLATIYTPMQSNFWQLSSTQAKMASIMIGVFVGGGTFTKDGSFLVERASSKGEGIEAFRSNTEIYEQKFYNEELEKYLNDVVPDTLAALITIHAFFGFNPGMNVIYWAPVIATGTGFAAHMNANENEVLYNAFAHANIISKIQKGSPSILEQALDDTPLFGGRTSTQETRAGISASSVGTSTASFNDYDQAFALLSNLDSTGKELDIYHTVTIEAITKSDSPLSFPIEIDGKKEIVTAVTVKEPPTAVKGVINTYLPKKLKQFQYSENFATWKDVGEVDKWGNFTLKELKLAEGQNVVAFRAESWTGNKSTQLFKIILNTIPMVPSNLLPLPGTYQCTANRAQWTVGRG